MFSPNSSPRTGQACYIRFAETHETTFKAFYPDPDGMIRLQPLNPAYPAQRVPPESIAAVVPATYKIVKID